MIKFFNTALSFFAVYFLFNQVFYYLKNYQKIKKKLMPTNDWTKKQIKILL